MRSTGLSLQLWAFTRHPSCAMITATQVWRSTVDLPPMFGPVTTRTPGTSPAFRTVSLGTKPERILAAATGWRQPLSSRVPISSPWSSTSSAWQDAPVRPLETLASESIASSSARHRTAARNCAWCVWNSLKSRERKGKRQSSRLFSSMSSSATRSLMRWVWKRTLLLLRYVTSTVARKACGIALSSHSTSYRYPGMRCMKANSAFGNLAFRPASSWSSFARLALICLHTPSWAASAPAAGWYFTFPLFWLGASTTLLESLAMTPWRSGKQPSLPLRVTCPRRSGTARPSAKLAASSWMHCW
mmetsp:Transcript_50875/g.149932  ORF Transcript_50875/g.149932 Transcript_50875/m.149932 type:complete len:302 (-) Transcript_50875:1489-2394(-)